MRFLTIKQLQEKLLNKEFTATQLVQEYISKINELNPKLNAFITITEDLAFEEAKKVDQIISEKGKTAFDEYPLLGVVISHKDLFLTKGIKTTAASKLLDSYIPQYSATVVKKLKDAGAITVGKLNMDAWAHGSSGENSDFGPTKNPWNREYVPGGSSSGSGASVAAGLSMIATSTDTCGSTRLPANYCGLVGLKPTYGAVSRYGAVAMASSLDTMGHITRTVEDSRKVFEITKGVDGHDGTVVDFEFGKSKKLNDLVIGVPKEFFGEGIDPQVRKNVENVISFYEKKGIKIMEVSLPTTEYAIGVYYIIQPAEVSSNLGRHDGVRFGNTRNSFGSEAKRRIMIGTYALSSGYYDAYYDKAMRVRSKIINEVNEVFEKVDALIAPVSPTSAFKIGEKANDPLKMYLTDIYAATANLSGIPGLAVPSGFDTNGLPLGFQLMSKRFGENVLFDLGELYQSENDFTDRKPDIS